MKDRIFIGLWAFAFALAAPPARAQEAGDLWWPKAPPGPVHPVEPPDEAAPKAPEPAAPSFGAQGEWVLTAASSLGASWTQYDASDANALSVSFAPGIDYFVLDQVSIGMTLDARHDESRGYDALGNLLGDKSDGFSAGARLGANLPLGGAFSLWPQATFGAFYDKAQETLVRQGQGPSVVTPTTADTAGFWLDAFVPVLFHPVPHFFLGLGPYVNHAFSRDQSGLNGLGDRTDANLKVVVGGWWGGQVPAAATSAASDDRRPTPPEARMGDRGHWVFTGESGGSAGVTTYTASGGSAWSGTLAAGTDYFLADHVAMGLALQVGASNEAEQSVGGLVFTRNSSQFGLVPRFVFEIPLGASVSLLPRAEVGISHNTNDIREEGQSEHYTEEEFWVGAGLPIVAHVATHFFVGAGPYVSRDVAREANFSNGGSENVPGTKVGGRLLVGGWL